MPNPNQLDNNKVAFGIKINRLGLGTLALLVALAVPLAALADGPPPHHFASLQLLHPLATSPNPETTTNFRLSVFYGRSGDVTAFQLNGLYSGTGGLFRGMSATLGLTHTKRGAAGFRFSGLGNYNEDAFAGVQMAGVLNYTRRGLAGAQIASVLNINDGAGTFLQLSSVANINAGPFAGFQVSVFLNAANSQMGGGQLGVLNYAENMKGVQVGVINMGASFHGLKVGVVNSGQEITGTTIGLVNQDLDSRKEWMFYGSNLSLINIGYRTVLNHWSSVVSTGYGDVQGDVSETLFFGWNFGRNFPLSQRWDLTLDLGYQHIIPQASDNPDDNDRLHYSLQARALADYRLNDKLGLVGSVGSSTVYSEYSSEATSQTDFLFTAGIVLY